MLGDIRRDRRLTRRHQLGGLQLPNDGSWYESKERSSKGFTKIPGRGRPEMKWYRDSYAVFHPELDRYVCHCE